MPETPETPEERSARIDAVLAPKAQPWEIKRLWCRDSMLLVLYINQERADMIRVGWN